MNRFMFILLLAAGCAGLIVASQQIIQQDSALAFDWLFAGSFFPAVIGAGGLLGIIRPTRKSMELTAQVDAQGFREVLSGKPIDQRRSANLLLLITSIVLAIAMSMNVLRARGPVSGDRMLFITTLWVPVVILAIVQRRIWNLSSAITQPRLFIQPFPINRGTPLRIRLSVQAKQPLGHLHVRAWLLCTETTVLFLRRQNLAVRKNVVEYIAVEEEQTKLAAGALLEVNSRLTISAGTPASGSASVIGYPNYEWTLHVEITGSRKLITDFPLEVG